VVRVRSGWPSDGLKIFGGSLQGIFEYSTLSYVGGDSNNAANSVQDAGDIAFGIRYLMLDQEKGAGEMVNIHCSMFSCHSRTARFCARTSDDN
jgi:hypothetical protein